jgi:hypothetical protein
MERDSGLAPQESHTSTSDKHSDGSHATGHILVKGNKQFHSGNSMNLNQICNDIVHSPLDEAKNSSSCADREVHDSPGMVDSHEEITIAQVEKIGEGDLVVEVLCPGGSESNPMQGLQNEFGYQYPPMIGSPQAKGKMNKGMEDLGVQDSSSATPLKRRKRREGSIDEDSSAQAETLKAKRNLDSPGMLSAKSFLSFSDSKIVGNITSLGVSLGKDVASTVASMKDIECNRVLQVPTNAPRKLEMCCLDEEDGSDMDSDLGLDHTAIQHLIGDIADDILGTKGTPWSDFKPVSRKSKSGSARKGRGKKKVNIQSRNFQ